MGILPSSDRARTGGKSPSGLEVPEGLIRLPTYLNGPPEQEPEGAIGKLLRELVIDVPVPSGDAASLMQQTRFVPRDSVTVVDPVRGDLRLLSICFAQMICAGRAIVFSQVRSAQSFVKASHIERSHPHR